MKPLNRFLSLLIVLLSLESVSANPITWFFMRELQFDGNSFNMELSFMGEGNLDGWFLTSMTDTAYFNSGITYNSGFLVVTQADLQKTFNFNPTGDVIGIHCVEYNSDFDEFRFGDVDESHLIAPTASQSMCLLEYENPFQSWTYYLDNTPTLGTENDSTGAMGYIQGTVRDSLGNPLAGIAVISYINYYNWNFEAEPIYVVTDENGYYIFEAIARRIGLGVFNADSEVVWIDVVQGLPEDTVTVDLTTENYVGIDHEDPVRVSDFEINSIYPNPFNSTTTIVYTLENSNYLEISVYDMKGRLADQVYSGNENSGRHTLHWNVGQLPAGVYFVYLQTPRGSVSQKLVYLK